MWNIAGAGVVSNASFTVTQDNFRTFDDTVKNADLFELFQSHENSNFHVPRTRVDAKNQRYHFDSNPSIGNERDEQKQSRVDFDESFDPVVHDSPDYTITAHKLAGRKSDYEVGDFKSGNDVRDYEDLGFRKTTPGDGSSWRDKLKSMSRTKDWYKQMQKENQLQHHKLKHGTGQEVDDFDDDDDDDDNDEFEEFVHSTRDVNSFPPAQYLRNVDDDLEKSSSSSSVHHKLRFPRVSCNDMECLASAACSEESGVGRCRCPLGTSGQFCESGMHIYLFIYLFIRRSFRLTVHPLVRLFVSPLVRYSVCPLVC